MTTNTISTDIESTIDDLLGDLDNPAERILYDALALLVSRHVDKHGTIDSVLARRVIEAANDGGVGEVDWSSWDREDHR